MRAGLDQPQGRHRHRPHRDPPRLRESQRALRNIPQLQIERQHRDPHAARGAGVIGVLDLDFEPPCREPPLAEPLSQRRGQASQQRVQHAELVAVGAQRVRQAVLCSDFGSQHGPGIDAASLGAEQPATTPEDRAQRTLADAGHLADPLELVFVEPQPDVVGDSREHAHQVRREEGGLVAAGDTQCRSAFRPPHPGGRLRHQLVDRDSHHQRQAQLCLRVPPDPLGDIDRRAEQPLGAGEVEKRMAVPAGLDDGSVYLENGAQRTRDARIQPGIGRQQHQVGAQLASPAHQHAPGDSRGLRFAGEREHGRTVCAGGCDGDRPAAQRRRHQLFDGGAEGRGIDEENGLQQQ